MLSSITLSAPAMKLLGIHLVVEYERTFEFCLPRGAFPVVKAHLAPDLLQQAPSPSVPSAIAGLIRRK
jgi:hypothetical protein